MNFYIFYLTGCLICGLAILIIVNFIRLLKKKKPKLYRFEFSIFNYHVFISIFVIPLIIWSIIQKDSEIIKIFLVFMITGIIGEQFFLFFKIIYSKKNLDLPSINNFLSLALASLTSFLGE
ncbi:MAG: hypothetical protein KatS3mg085_226 [Candidatus Dojkabacteria bacterium]|nr:MAG: hypothetical protein KatS3mg085_226 [Candidatus Dojkabacteria bacterium]